MTRFVCLFLQFYLGLFPHMALNHWDLTEKRLNAECARVRARAQNRGALTKPKKYLLKTRSRTKMRVFFFFFSASSYSVLNLLYITMFPGHHGHVLAQYNGVKDNAFTYTCVIQEGSLGRLDPFVSRLQSSKVLLHVQGLGHGSKLSIFPCRSSTAVKRSRRATYFIATSSCEEDIFPQTLPKKTHVPSFTPQKFTQKFTKEFCSEQRRGSSS